MSQSGSSSTSISLPQPPSTSASEGVAAPVPRPTAPGGGGGPREGRRTALLLGLLIGALLILPPAGAAAWSYTQPASYASQVDLLHEPSDTSASDSIDRQLATHQVLLLRPSLLDDAAESVGRDPEQLTENVSVEIVEGSSLLRLQVVDPDRDRAERTAAVVADRYVGIADLLAPTSNIGRVRLVSPPTVLDEPVGPQPLRAAAAGALLGLVLVLAFLALLRLRYKASKHSAP